MKILITGFYGAGNTGDEAILSAIISSITEMYPDTSFTILSHNPIETEKMHCYKAISQMSIGLHLLKSDFSGIWNSIKSADLVILGGGGIMEDVHSYFAIPKYILVALLAKTLNKPVMSYSVGIGPVRNRLSKLLIYLFWNEFDTITVRDVESKELLLKLGVTKTPIYVSVDPVFNLNPVNGSRGKAIFDLESIPLVRPIIGVSVRYVEWSKFDFNELAKFLDQLSERKLATIVFIPFGYDGVPSDFDTSVLVMNKMRSESFVLKGRYSHSELMSIIDLCDFVVGMRLHSLIMSSIVGTPLIGLSYLPKVQSALRAIGYPEEFILKNDNETSCFAYMKLFEDIWSMRADLIDQIKENIARLKPAALLPAKMIGEIRSSKCSKLKLLLLHFTFVFSVVVFIILQIPRSIIYRFNKRCFR